MLLDKIKSLLRIQDIPSEVQGLYKDARNEREALFFLKDALHRDEERLRRALEDVEILQKREEDLVEDGKAETSQARKFFLARQIKALRAKAAEINFRVERIYNKRIRIYGEHIKSIETLLDLMEEPLPDAQVLEDAAIRAREKLEELDQAYATAEGIRIANTGLTLDEEEKAILAEFEGAESAQTAPESQILESRAPEPRTRETPEEIETEPEPDEPRREEEDLLE